MHSSINNVLMNEVLTFTASDLDYCSGRTHHEGLEQLQLLCKIPDKKQWLQQASK